MTWFKQLPQDEIQTNGKSPNVTLYEIFMNETYAFFQGKLFLTIPRSKSYLKSIYQKFTYCMRQLNPFPSIMPNDSPHFLWITELLKKEDGI